MVKIDRSQVMTRTPYSNKGINKKTVIALHETANRSKGAGAYAHHRLQWNGNSREASWHYQVDDSVAVQSFSEDLRLWHAGSVAIPYTIAIEMCVNSDSDYNKMIDNAIDLVVDIMKRNGITSNNVVTHYFYTGKNCPTILLSGKSGWTYKKFIKEVNRRLGSKGKPVKQPVKNKVTNKVKTDRQLAKEVIRGKYGSGAERMRKLGKRYENVQRLVNQMIKTGNTTVNYDKLVKDTLAGKYGNGATRRRKLGTHYNEVQRRINNMYK